MTEKSKRFEKELDKLRDRGAQLAVGIQYECYGEKFKRQLSTTLKVDEVEKYVKLIPNFRREYQAWYSEALSLIKQVLPDRLEDFKSYYEYRRVRKELTFENYMIRDFLQGLRVTRRSETVVDGTAAISHFDQQLNIVEAARVTLGSALIDLTNILQADLFDSELDSARALGKSGFLRAAGAICGVILEKHLKQMCDVHGVAVKKRNPVISDFNQALRDCNLTSVPQWRFVQHLADIRNVCDHARAREPEKGEIDDLVSGTAKVLKTYF